MKAAPDDVAAFGCPPPAADIAASAGGPSRAAPSRLPRQPQQPQWRAPARSALDAGGSLVLSWRAAHGRGASSPYSGWLSGVLVLAVLHSLGAALSGQITSVGLQTYFGALHQLAVAVGSLSAVFVALTWPPWAAVRLRLLSPHSAVLTIAHVLPVAALLLGPVAVVYGSSFCASWHFLQRCAIMLEGGVLAMKAHSFHLTQRALALDVAGGGSGCGSAVDILRAERERRLRSEGGAGDPSRNDPHSDPLHCNPASLRGEAPISPTSRAPPPTMASSTMRATRTEELGGSVASAAAADSSEIALVAASCSDCVSPFRGVTREGRAWELAQVAWPNNISLADTVHYLCEPALVYAPNRALFVTISPASILEKVLLASAIVAVGLLVYEGSIKPVLARIHSFSPVELIAQLVAPVTLCFLAAFFITFECTLNVAGELTRSASRTFYGSFQDATSFAEFSRSWNLLVHDWLRRYVFEPTASASGSPSVAVSVTFIVSIAVHEMVMFAALKPSYRYVPWLALFSLAQLPLYALARHPALHGKRAGNLFFWSGLSLGVTAITVLYARDRA